MYWRVLTKYLRDEGAEDCLELLLPELTQKGQASTSAGSDAFFDAAETLSPSPKKNAAAVQVSFYAILQYFLSI